MTIGVTVAARLGAQSVSINVDGAALRITAPAFHFIDGPVFDRLRDGRAARLAFVLSALARPNGAALTKDEQTFILSLDLWEQRVAATRVGKPARSISHLKPADAEGWCLGHLALPVAALARAAGNSSFWLRLEYRLQEPDPETDPDGSTLFTLRNLIDRLSRRPASNPGKTVEAGPFQVPH